MCPSSRYALASHQLCVGMCVGAYDSYAHTPFKRVSVLVDLLLHENNLSQTHVSFVERDVLLPTNVMIICHYKRHIVMLSCAACHTPSGTQPQVCPPQIVSVRSIASAALTGATIAHMRRRCNSSDGSNDEPLRFYGKRVNVWLLLSRGATGATAMTLYYFSIKALPLPDAVVIFFTNVVFTAVLSVLGRYERASWPMFAGCCVCVGVGCCACDFGLCDGSRALLHPRVSVTARKDWITCFLYLPTRPFARRACMCC